MKYVILLGDGMADYPIESLGGKTPLQAAHTPNMDQIAAEGTLGLIDTIPPGYSPGSDVAIMTLFGYDAKKYYSGRGPLEAANMGVQLGSEDVAFRCNLVTLKMDKNVVMDDFTAGHISSREAKQIITDVQAKLGTDEFQFYPGVSYRHLLVWKRGMASMKTTPPHDITGKSVKAYLPKGKGAGKILDLMKRSQDVLCDHLLNRQRLADDRKPANSIWLWGQGRAPKMVKLTEKYGLKGGMISAVDLLNGIGTYAGLDVIRVEGVTGYTDTNYLGKATEALNALKKSDFIFVHVEAPDEMGHEGNIDGKIRAIEDFDEKIVGTVVREIHSFSPFRLMVLTDHPTPIALKTHASNPSPFAVFSSVRKENLRNGISFSESSALNSEIIVSPGHLLMDFFIKHWDEFIEKSR
jgi:2,3-bisphosphoglycerate-independent phosphoglycerate mutase